jgi:hypothetical protein
VERCKTHYLDWCERHGKLWIPGDPAVAVFGFYVAVYPEWCARRGLRSFAPPSWDDLGDQEARCCFARLNDAIAFHQRFG